MVKVPAGGKGQVTVYTTRIREILIWARVSLLSSRSRSGIPFEDSASVEAHTACNRHFSTTSVMDTGQC